MWILRLKALIEIWSALIPRGNEVYNFVARTDHSDLQIRVAHITMYVHISWLFVATSSNKKLCRRYFDGFCGRFGYQELLLSINFDDKIILQRTMKKYGPIASKK